MVCMLYFNKAVKHTHTGKASHLSSQKNPWGSFSLSGEKDADGLPGGWVSTPAPASPRHTPFFYTKARMGKSIYEPPLRNSAESSL